MEITNKLNLKSNIMIYLYYQLGKLTEGNPTLYAGVNIERRRAGVGEGSGIGVAFKNFLFGDLNLNFFPKLQFC